MFKHATLFALFAGSALATIITSVDISAYAANFGFIGPPQGQSCSYTGPDAHSCSAHADNSDATASVSFPDQLGANILNPSGAIAFAFTFPKLTSVEVSGGTFHVAGANATGSISHDDVYNIDGAFSGSLFGAFTFWCDEGLGGMSGHSIQGGPLQMCPAFPAPAGPGGIPAAIVRSGTSLVPIEIVNGQAEVTYFTTASFSDTDGTYAQSALALTGFQDSLGNPVAATLTPEPASWTLAASGLLLVSWKRRKALLMTSWFRADKRHNDGCRSST